jgi:hypothetical protein
MVLQTARTSSGIRPFAVKTAQVPAGICRTSMPSGTIAARVTPHPIRYEYSPLQSLS